MVVSVIFGNSSFSYSGRVFAELPEGNSLLFVILACFESAGDYLEKGFKKTCA